jgi:hypothetical protein
MSKFTALLANLPVGLTKNADIESPDEVQLEQDFARLAYTFLKDRAAGLIPYLLGFEVVEREEDGSKAVGMFGFKIGKDYYYVPAFFVNNQIKGMDLLFAKNTNMFVPLREPWINHIINRQTIQLGGPISEPEPLLRRQFERPRFDFLANPPTSVGGMPKASEAIQAGFSAWNDLQQAMIDSIEKDAEFQQAWAGAIARLEKTPLPFAKTAEGSRLIDWIEKKGGVKAVNVLFKTLTENPGFAKAALTFYPGIESLFVTKFAAELAPVKQAAKITVITEKTDYIDGKETKRLVRDGFTIHDTREPSEKSETYEVDYVKRFTAPDKPGLYNVLLRNGGTAQAWVFMPSAAAKNKYLLVVDTDAKNYFMAEPGALFVRDGDIVEGPNAFDKTIELPDMKIGHKYVLINAHGEASMPVEIRSIVAEDGKRVKMHVYHPYGPKYERPTYGHDFATLHTHNSVPTTACEDRDYICLADYEGRNLAQSGRDTIIVPSNWKALEIQPGNKDLESYEAKSVQESMFQPGSETDVMDALAKNAFHKVTVGSDDKLEYYVQMDDSFVDGKPMNYKTAMVRLVGKYGMSVDDAEAMLKESKDNFKSKRLVKFSQSPMVGVYMPPEQPVTYGIDEFTGVTEQPAQNQYIRGQMTGVVPPQNTMRPGFNIGGETAMDLQAAGLGQEAANAGQKQVFDHSTIGGLSKVYDSGAVIDSYVPELMKSLDRLGRILFLFYWKNEEFTERYGNEDMAEMEDTIRGVFKSFGDLVLQLREKTIGSEETTNTII